MILLSVGVDDKSVASAGIGRCCRRLTDDFTGSTSVTLGLRLSLASHQ